MSEWPVTDKIRPRPTYARYVARRLWRLGNGPPLPPPTEDEKRDAVRILGEPFMWADEVSDEAQRILDEAEENHEP